MTTFNNGQTAHHIVMDLFKKGTSAFKPEDLVLWWNRTLTDVMVGEINLERGGLSDSYFLKPNDPDKFFEGCTPTEIIDCTLSTYSTLDGWMYWDEYEDGLNSSDDVRCFIDKRRWVEMIEWLEYCLNLGIVPDLPFLNIKND